MIESWAANPAVRAVMRSNRSQGTAPEWRVRRLAHACGLRYRVNHRPLPEHRLTADLVFSRVKVAVYIDGCYWHGCPQHYRPARTNAAFWAAKISTNKDRDERTRSLLHDAGWVCLRFWEHEDPHLVVQQIQVAIEKRR